VVWKKTLSLEATPDKRDRWVPVGLDLSPLVAQGPGGLYRLALSFRRSHVVWPCEGDSGEEEELTAAGELASGEQEESYWDAWWQYEGEDWRGRYEGRHDPCHPGYYERFYDHDIRAARNVLVSDIGLVAKAGEDGLVLLAATDLRTAAPLPGAEVSLRDYQQETLASGRTDGEGFVRLEVEGLPSWRWPATGARPATCAWTTGAPSPWPTSTSPGRAPRRGSRASSTGSAGSGVPGTRCT